MSNTTETGWPLRSEAAAEATERQFIARVGGIVELRRDAIIAALEKENPTAPDDAFVIAIEAAGLPGLITIVGDWLHSKRVSETGTYPRTFADDTFSFIDPSEPETENPIIDPTETE